MFYSLSEFKERLDCYLEAAKDPDGLWIVGKVMTLENTIREEK